MLNSMWGKFGQRQNKMQVREFTEPQAFHEFLDSDQNDIRYVSTLTEDRVEVPLHQTRPLPVSVSQPEHLRGLLHHLLGPAPPLRGLAAVGGTGPVLRHRLGGLCGWMVFAHRPGQASPALGQYLGEFKDELGHGESIVEFCSAGPKNYGYKTRAGQTVCKVRGFSLNCQGAAQLNYQVLRQNVLDELHTPLAEPRTTRVTQSHTIQRQAKDYTLHTRPHPQRLPFGVQQTCGGSPDGSELSLRLPAGSLNGPPAPS